MDIKLSDEQTTALLHKAILESLGADGQQRIIQEVVKHLTTKPIGYNNRAEPSPLQVVLHRVSENIAQALIREKLENDPELVRQIDSLYVEAFEKLFGADNRKDMVDKLSRRMADALSDR